MLKNVVFKDALQSLLHYSLGVSMLSYTWLRMTRITDWKTANELNPNVIYFSITGGFLHSKFRTSNKHQQTKALKSSTPTVGDIAKILVSNICWWAQIPKKHIQSTGDMDKKETKKMLVLNYLLSPKFLLLSWILSSICMSTYSQMILVNFDGFRFYFNFDSYRAPTRLLISSILGMFCLRSYYV